MDSPSITEEALRKLESLAPPLNDSWYFISAVALCSLGQDKAVFEVFQYACHDARVADSEQSRRSQRIRDALIKAIPAIGMPKVRKSRKPPHVNNAEFCDGLLPGPELVADPGLG